MDSLPLPTLLSQALVAFTIEFDNEFERQVPHRTTNHGSTTGSRSAPWLVSMVLWLKFMRFVPVNGIAAPELQRLAELSDKQMQTQLTRMSKWWGYVVVDSGGMVRPTPGGRKALEAWRPLTGVIGFARSVSAACGANHLFPDVAGCPSTDDADYRRPANKRTPAGRSARGIEAVPGHGRAPLVLNTLDQQLTQTALALTHCGHNRRRICHNGAFAQRAGPARRFERRREAALHNALAFHDPYITIYR